MSNLLGKGGLGKGGLGKSGFGGGGLSKAMKSSRVAEPPDAPLKALSLLGRWGRVALGHVAFGGGCSCAGGMGPIHMSEMEMHVMDYLAAKYSDNSAIQSLLIERGGYKPNEAGSIGEVLNAIATRAAGAVKPEDQIAMLADLERSIESLDEITRGG
ncbi:MAG: hypothetical protein EXR28_17345 [Betaproteobacteria bacterium]|nr:hypothetical protein [Betaproteobacteria bacterium]